MQLLSGTEFAYVKREHLVDRQGIGIGDGFTRDVRIRVR